MQKLRLDYAFQELAKFVLVNYVLQCGGRRSFELVAQSGRLALGVGLRAED